MMEQTNQARHHASYRGCYAEEVCNGGAVDKFVLKVMVSLRFDARDENHEQPTGTLRWVITTDVSFPLIATAVCPDPEIALNAYSVSLYQQLEL